MDSARGIKVGLNLDGSGYSPSNSASEQWVQQSLEYLGQLEFPFLTTKKNQHSKIGNMESRISRGTNIMYKFKVASFLAMTVLTKHSANDISFFNGNTTMIKKKKRMKQSL
jgi:hypothetical protein